MDTTSAHGISQESSKRDFSPKKNKIFPEFPRQISNPNVRAETETMIEVFEKQTGILWNGTTFKMRAQIAIDKPFTSGDCEGIVSAAKNFRNAQAFSSLCEVWSGSKVLDGHSPSDESRSTALIYATSLGNIQYVQELCLSHADISIKNKQGLNAIHVAALEGRDDCLSFLLAMRPNLVDEANSNGMTAVNIAANAGKDKCLKLLIDLGADINKANKNGYTPLNNAAESGREACLKLLIDGQADLNSSSMNLYTPVCTAALMGKDLCLDLLLKAGGDFKKPCNTGASPLYLTAQNGKLGCLQLLIDKKADINAQRYDGNTPLIAAASLGRDSCVEFLVKNGANLNVRNKSGRTAIFVASEKGHVTCVDILISAGADINVPDFDMWTPLSIISQEESREHALIAERLLTAGAKKCDPPSYPMNVSLPHAEPEPVLPVHDQSNVDEMKIQTMYKMVDECKVIANGKEVLKKVLYLTNKQCLLFDEAAMGRCVQALDVGEPKFVIKLLPSLGIRSQMKIAHPESAGQPDSEYGYSTMRSSEIDDTDERAISTQTLLFMKSCILPLAKQTRALVLVSGANNCYLSAALASVALTEQARLGKECPFTVIATASEGEVHSRAVSGEDQGSVATQILKGSQAWRKRVSVMNSFYSKKFLREGIKMKQCDLTLAASRYIIFEDYDDEAGSINAGPRRAFESIFLQYLTRKLPSIAIQAFNIGEGVPFISDLLSRNIPVMLLDSTERAITMTNVPSHRNPLTVLATNSCAFPSLSSGEFSKISFDESGITHEARLSLLFIAFEMYLRKYEVLIKYGKIDTQDASTIAFFHSTLLLGTRPPKWRGKTPLHLRIKEMEHLHKRHNDSSNATSVIKPEFAVKVIEFLQAKGLAMRKKAELSSVQKWVKNHDKKLDHLMSLAMASQRSLQSICDDIQANDGIYKDSEVNAEGWLALYEVLTSANTYSTSLFDVDETKSILGSIAKIDRLPNSNSLEALRILQDCWDHVEMYQRYANSYKMVTKASYVIMLLVGIAISSCAVAQSYAAADFRISIMALAFIGSTLAAFVSFTNPAVKWQQLRTSALCIESEIWAFRTRAGSYRTKGEGFDDSSERHLAAILKEIKDKVLEGADIKSTEFYGNTGVRCLHDQHESRSPQSTKNYFSRKENDINSNKNEKVPYQEEMDSVVSLDIESPSAKTQITSEGSIRLTEVVRRLSQMDMDGEGTEHNLADSHYEPVQPDRYIEFRVQKSLEFYKSRIPKENRTRNICQLLLVLGSTASVILPIFYLQVLAAVVSVFTASIVAFLEFSGNNSKLQRYSATVHSLQALVVWWKALPQIDRSVVANIDRLVVSCEDLLHSEHQAWKSTSQTLRMLQKASSDVSNNIGSGLTKVPDE